MEKWKRCPACSGTGRNQRGYNCPVCSGRGSVKGDVEYEDIKK